MPSTPKDNTQERMMSGVECHHLLWAAQTVGCVGRGMPSPPLDSRHGRMTSGVACHHCPWTGNMIERCRAWHAINTLRQNTRKNDVGRNMTLSPLGSTHGRMMSGVACHNRLKAAHTIERRRAWYDITAFGQHTRSNDVRHDITSPPLDSTHCRTKSRMACHHIP